jgi:predicted DNA-binding transcriptional regulator AlpA
MEKKLASGGELIRTKDVAKLAGVIRKTVFTWIYMHKLKPDFKFPRVDGKADYLFKVSKIEEWLEKREEKLAIEKIRLKVRAKAKAKADAKRRERVEARKLAKEQAISPVAVGESDGIK